MTEQQITNDNPSLSLPNPAVFSSFKGSCPIDWTRGVENAGGRRVVSGTDSPPPRDARNIDDYVAAATADNTRRAYRSDLRAFLSWGGNIPSVPETVAAYLVSHATTLSP